MVLPVGLLGNVTKNHPLVDGVGYPQHVPRELLLEGVVVEMLGIAVHHGDVVGIADEQAVIAGNGGSEDGVRVTEFVRVLGNEVADAPSAHFQCRSQIGYVRCDVRG